MINPWKAKRHHEVGALLEPAEETAWRLGCLEPVALAFLQHGKALSSYLLFVGIRTATPGKFATRRKLAIGEADRFSYVTVLTAASQFGLQLYWVLSDICHPLPGMIVDAERASRTT